MGEAKRKTHKRSLKANVGLEATREITTVNEIGSDHGVQPEC